MIAPSYTHRFIQADFLTSSYRFVGEVRVTNTGLMGLLVDTCSADRKPRHFIQPDLGRFVELVRSAHSERWLTAYHRACSAF